MAWSRINNTSYENPSWASSMTFSHTVSAGSNLLLLVSVALWDNGDYVTGVTYNNFTMNKAIDTDIFTTWKPSLWYLVAPATGTNNVVVSFGGGDSSVLGAVAGATTFTGIDQTTPLRPSTATGFLDYSTIQNPYVDIPNCVANDLVYGVCIRNGSDLTPADTSDWVQFNNTDGEIGSGTYTNATTGTVQLNWTSGSIDNWGCAGAAFVPASSATLASRKTLLGVGR